MTTRSARFGWIWVGGLSALLVLVSLAAWRASRPQAAADQARDALAHSLARSAALDLPRQVDPDSRIQSVRVAPDGALTFEVLLTSLDPEDFEAAWLDEMSAMMRERVCRSPDALPLLAAGGSVVYALQLTDHRAAGRIQVRSADCQVGET